MSVIQNLHDAEQTLASHRNMFLSMGNPERNFTIRVLRERLRNIIDTDVAEVSLEDSAREMAELVGIAMMTKWAAEHDAKEILGQ